MSDQSQGPGWWRATDGRWYPPETHPYYGSQPPPEQRDGWWLARDGYWYPLELHPDCMPAEVEPTVAVHEAPRASIRRRTAWHERTRGRVAFGVTGVFVLAAMVGTLADDIEEPATRVRSNLVQTTVPAVVQETTTLATTTTITTVAPTTVATTPGTSLLAMIRQGSS